MPIQRPVRVSIEGVSLDDDGAENIHLSTQGSLAQDETGFVLCYEETAPESAISGTTSLDCHLERVTMKREGEVLTVMVFQKNSQFLGSYQTPYGSLALRVYTQEARYALDADQGFILLQYRLDINGHVTTLRLDIQFSVQEAA